MQKFLGSLVFAFCMPASATTYYFSDCGAGRDPACIAGNDTASGTSPVSPFRTSAKFQAVFNAALPGDQILLAKGAAWDAISVTLHNNYSAASAGNLAVMTANRVVVDSYTPSWGSGTAKPRLNGTTTGAALSFYAGSSGTKDGGFIFRNLSFQSPGYYNNSAIGLLRWPNNILFENLTVNGFAGGFTCGGQPQYAYPSGITVRKSTFTNNGKLGIGSFGCSNVVIENNTLDNNGFDDSVLTGQPINQNHPLYVSGTDGLASAFAAGVPRVATGVVVRGNTLTNNSICPAVGSNGYNPAHTCQIGKCSATVIVGHDRMADWIIENNTISNADGAVGNGCWGIGISPANGGYSEYQLRVAIRGNTIVNPGNTAIRTTACQGCLIENNNVLWTEKGVTSAGGTVDCILAVENRVSASPEPTYQNTNVTVRNNTCYAAKTTDISHGVSVKSVGTGHIVTNNLIVFDPSGANVAAYCVDTTGLPMSAFTAFDNNHCYHYANWTPTLSLAAWQATPGSPDARSLASDPLLIGVPSQANPGNTAIGAGSPAKGAGNAVHKAARDRTTCARPSPPSIGAHEYFAAPCGTKPSYSPTQVR